MSDLVERLQWWGDKRRAPRNMPTLPSDCRDAVAELLRLQEENARLSEKAIIGEYMHTPAELAEAITKARREALEEAAKVADKYMLAAQHAGSIPMLLGADGISAEIRSLKDKESGK